MPKEVHHCIYLSILLIDSAFKMGWVKTIFQKHF